MKIIKYSKYEMSDANDSSVPYYANFNTPIMYNTTLPDTETATDHPLIRLLDFLQRIFITSCDKTANFITNLEIKIINKRKKKKMSEKKNERDELD